MPLADFTLGDALLTVLEIFLFVIYFWILITIFSDLFRDHQMSGWGKAGWILLIFFVPFTWPLVALWAMAPPSSSFVTSSCVTVLITSGPVTNM